MQAMAYAILMRRWILKKKYLKKKKFAKKLTNLFQKLTNFIHKLTNFFLNEKIGFNLFSHLKITPFFKNKF